MHQDPVQEPQHPYTQDPYSFNPYPPYDPQQAQPTFVSQTPQYAYPGNMSHDSGQGGIAPKRGTAAQLWQGLVKFLGGRGLLTAAGAVLAILSFLIMPYYSNYSGYFLASQVLDDKWWLELALPLLALIVLIAQQVIPRIKQQHMRWSLILAASGVLGILLHYWFIDAAISSNYWRPGTWGYFLGMALIAAGGLLLVLGPKKAR
ncbi:hypothetical protein EPA93_12175 [Ktedonosporobacter rubrisoli]|uniref:Uncharacterized protein n=1 Tax=Ktedonosporobacter rubrisoli TaxID=2509675 RepID=A0A4P6JN53_KTERU|nr:hypothetical protein [Ktedonosporobacter rubrisoli]QBD76719.1 hypothetical protein EPA93_12175 [Ktedonosporobacter rubrisoli]